MTTVIWMVAFDDEQGASLFAEFYRKILDRVDGEKDLQGVLDQINGPAPHSLEQVDNRVLIVAGPGAMKFSSLAPAVWLASQVVDPNPTAPDLEAYDQRSIFTRELESVKDWLREWVGLGQRRDPLKY